MPRKQHATRPPADSPDNLPDSFGLFVRRIPGGWSVRTTAVKEPFVGAGTFGLMSALLGALKALARGGK